MKIIISNSSNEPIYQQIVRQLKEGILKGHLTAGSALPSIRGLAKELHISVITTKRAYEELERGGVSLRRRPVGVPLLLFKIGSY